MALLPQDASIYFYLDFTEETKAMIGEVLFAFQEDERNIRYLIKKTETASGQYTEFDYDHRNRLVRGTVISAGGVILREVTYTYDVFDRAIAPGQNHEQHQPPDYQEHQRAAEPSHRLHLFQFDQRAAEILRVQEQNRLAVRPRLRLAVAQHRRPLHLQTIPRRCDVVDFVTDMVNAARRVAVEKLHQRRA